MNGNAEVWGRNMNDAIGQEINVGDRIVYPKQIRRTGENIIMERGTVVGFGARFRGRDSIPIVRVRLDGQQPRGKEVIGIEHPERMVVIHDEPDRREGDGLAGTAVVAGIAPGRVPDR